MKSSVPELWGASEPSGDLKHRHPVLPALEMGIQQSCEGPGSLTSSDDGVTECGNPVVN